MSRRSGAGSPASRTRRNLAEKFFNAMKISFARGWVSYRKRGLANLAVFRSQNAFGKCVLPGITSQMA